MEQIGLLFKDGKISSTDLEYLHTIPYMEAVRAIKECGISSEVTICDNCLFTKKIRDKFDIVSFVNDPSYANLFSRISTIVENAKDVNYTKPVCDELIHMIEERVDTYEKIQKFFEHACDIMTRDNSYSLRDFIVCDVIPMKLDDFYMSHSRESVIQEFVDDERNYLGEKWRNFVEAWFSEDMELAQKEFSIFCEAFCMPENNKIKMFESITKCEYIKENSNEYVESVVDTSCCCADFPLSKKEEIILASTYTQENLDDAFNYIGVNDISDKVSEDTIKKIIASDKFNKIGYSMFKMKNGVITENVLVRDKDDNLHIILETENDHDVYIVQVHSHEKEDIYAESFELNDVTFIDTLDA